MHELFTPSSTRALLSLWIVAGCMMEFCKLGLSIKRDVLYHLCLSRTQPNLLLKIKQAIVSPTTSMKMPRGLDRMFRDLLNLEDHDRRPSHRPRRHALHADHFDPVYMSGILDPRDDIGDRRRRREGLQLNRRTGGWDLDPNWHGGHISAAEPGRRREPIASVLYEPSGRRRSDRRNVSTQEARRNWCNLPVADGFSNYQPGMYRSSAFRYGGQYPTEYRNLSRQEAEHGWRDIPPSDGFRGYHPGLYADRSFQYGGHDRLSGHGISDNRMMSSREAEANWRNIGPSDGFRGYRQGGSSQSSGESCRSDWR